jgi:hypothetical protein
LYKYLVLITLALSSTKVAADFNTVGNVWFEQCKTNQFICPTYIWGLVDGENLHAQLKASKPLLCLKPGMSYAQLSDVLMKFLQDHPERRHEDFRNLTLEALAPLLRCN